MNQIWIVDDDQSIRWVLEKALSREGFEVRAFGGARECLRALEDDAPRVLVSDIRMPGASGLELLQQFKAQRPATPVIIMTAYSDLDSAVSAFQSGAFDYLPKPFDLGSAVDLIRRAWEESEREAAVEDVPDSGLDMIGQAPAMQEVFRAIGRLSQSNVTVLITGESGSGKELIARALHKHSPRGQQAFVALNTAAIPRDLLESELFGHERGAFTGAQQMRRGRFEQAEGGTLFLDEIGDMPAELQTRLLRVLSDGQYYRVGGHQPQKANVRVIAATHQNLEERVRQGLFREDLFHRLNVIRLRLPPLRERSADVPLLVRHFLQSSARELGGEPKRLTAGAMEALAKFSWPGNVRQLENTCRWLTVMAPAQVVDVKDLPPEIRDGRAEPGLHGVPAPMAGIYGAGASGAGAVPVAGVPAATHAEADSLGRPGWAGGTEGVLPGAVSAGAVPPAAVPMGQGGPGGAASVGASAGQAGPVGPAGEHEQGAGVPFARPQAGGLVYGTGTAPAEFVPSHHDGAATPAWVALLEREVSRRLSAQALDEIGESHSELMDQLSRAFESAVIGTALKHTRGRRIDAALRLGIGRNTITRKIQDLHLEDDEH